MKSTAIFTYLFLMSGNNGILTILQYDIFFYAKKWDFGSGNFLHSEINMLKLFKSKTIKYSVKVIKFSNSTVKIFTASRPPLGVQKFHRFYQQLCVFYKCSKLIKNDIIIIGINYESPILF